MNNKRRKEIISVINDIEDVINTILEEETEAFDNMPENLQCSERGCQSEEAQDNLNRAIELLDEVVICLEDSI